MISSWLFHFDGLFSVFDGHRGKAFLFRLFIYIIDKLCELERQGKQVHSFF